MRTELWAQQGDRTHLHGVRCRACTMVFFPPQHYGCENCGAEGGRLEPSPIPATGRLQGFTVVRQHRTAPTPFQIGEVLLDAGPIVRARLEHDSPAIGARVRGASRAGPDAEQFFFLPEADLS